MDNFENNREVKKDNIEEVISERMGISKESIPKSSWLRRALYSFLISASTFGAEAVAQTSENADTVSIEQTDITTEKTIEKKEEINKRAYEAADSLVQILKERGKLIEHSRENLYIWSNGKVTIKSGIDEKSGQKYQYPEIDYSGVKYCRSINWEDFDQDGHVSQGDQFIYSKTEGINYHAPGTLIVLEKNGDLRAFSGEDVGIGHEDWPLPPDGSKILTLDQVVELLESQIDLSN